MKQIPMLLALSFTMSVCSLCSFMDKSKNANGPGNSGGSSGDASVEKAEPSAAEKAALAGGQEIKWDRQGMTWTVPPNWTKVSDEPNSLLWHSPGGGDAANLIVTISPLADDFPVDISLNATHDSNKTRLKHGELDQLRWLELDGVKGTQFRESNPEKPDGIRRMQWISFRKYAGQVQQVNIMLSSSGKGFPGHQNEMNAILYSTKLVH